MINQTLKWMQQVLALAGGLELIIEDMDQISEVPASGCFQEIGLQWQERRLKGTKRGGGSWDELHKYLHRLLEILKGVQVSGSKRKILVVLMVPAAGRCDDDRQTGRQAVLS